MNKFVVKPRGRSYRCRVCGPLVCRADVEGFLGHIAFFIYVSILLIVVALILEWFLPSMNVWLSLLGLDLSALLLIMSVFIGGMRIFVKGFEELLEHREFDVDFLVFFAAVGGVLIGFYLEAALVVNLFVIADYLETIAVAKAENEIRSLIRYFPQKARAIRNGAEVEVPVETIKKGELIVVRPGERIPLDGIIVEGEANIDQSILTGGIIASI